MEKFYWLVTRGNEWATIRCPHCFEWYQIPNIPGEVECYRHCPWCGKPLFIREENRLERKRYEDLAQKE